ncbi:MAG: endolytic transglycosylase MltG [Bacteroidetes bacterium]|nr:endolytic transglycosylase MltG [Bacteroidota bacterium]MBS1628850.1 endolytic transglycosylase MltG [Bacteroidota bacterium]
MPTRRRKKKAGNKMILAILLLTLALGLIASFFVFGPNTGALGEGEYFYVHTGANYEQVKEALQEGGFVRDMKSFDFLARRADYPLHVHPGRYHIPPGMSNWSLIRMLHSGRQSPVNLVIGKLRTKEDFIRLVCTKLEADSITMKSLLHDDVYLAQFGLDSNSALCAVLPNTYQFYWNTNADKVYRKLERGFVAFWTPARKAKAQQLGLSPVQTIILASIVEEESNMRKEQPLIASVYLNRLKKGMKLQADPTARFAAGDFSIRRIGAAQTSLASPYNTYVVSGLPPGPICTASPKTIDAVLAAPPTDYLYFCARADFSGYHSFSSSYNEHLKNAQAYQQALNAHGY